MNVIEARGLRDFKTLLDRAPEATHRAAALALNHGARRGVTQGKREIARQVNLSQKYIGERLGVARFATPTTLEAVIAGRARPTSLWRFAGRQLSRKGRKAGVSVRVKPGRTAAMRRAFVMKLRRGGASADGFNVGIAIRLKPGDSWEGVEKPVSNEPGLYLLYGPSIDQVFDDVAPELAPGLSREMDNEFHRQFARLI